MEPTITKGYLPCDITPIHELEGRCFDPSLQWTREDLSAALDEEDVWIAKEGEALVGYLLSEAKTGEVHIISLAVDAEHQGKGITTHLLAGSELCYASNGVKRIRLEAQTGNPAQTLYFKLGYRVTGFKSKYYSDGSSAIAMCKKLIQS